MHWFLATCADWARQHAETTAFSANRSHSIHILERNFKIFKTYQLWKNRALKFWPRSIQICLFLVDFALSELILSIISTWYRVFFFYFVTLLSILVKYGPYSPSQFNLTLISVNFFSVDIGRFRSISSQFQPSLFPIIFIHVCCLLIRRFYIRWSSVSELYLKGS